jgi:hypothetical protein
MIDPRIGRLLIASLHQGILEGASTRVEFYEHWLSPTGLREGRMSVAALNAALSFLRREGGPTYHRIMTRAGQAAAEWTFLELSPMRRRIAGWMPPKWRARGALRVARRLVRVTFDDSRLKTRMWGSRGSLRLRESVFCSTREVSPDALCVYYAAAVERLLALYRVDAEIRISECKSAGRPHCLFSMAVRGTRVAEPEVEVV